MRLDLLRRGPGSSREPQALATTAVLAIGGLLLIWSSYIHFHLWQSVGYKHLHIIGPLFIVQSVAGLVLGLLILAVRQAWAAVLGLGFAASTLVGFLLTVSLPDGLFNFKESWAAPFAHQAFAIEIAAMAVLLVAGALCLAGGAAPTRTGATPAGSPS